MRLRLTHIKGRFDTTSRLYCACRARRVAGDLQLNWMLRYSSVFVHVCAEARVTSRIVMAAQIAATQQCRMAGVCVTYATPPWFYRMHRAAECRKRIANFATTVTKPCGVDLNRRSGNRASRLESGRPCLVVPYAGEFPTVGTRVLVAWDGGRESARAVHEAMPHLAGSRVHPFSC